MVPFHGEGAGAGVVLANGVRVYCGVASGRHADPYVYTAELEQACANVGLKLLCDAIFAQSEVCAPMPGLTSDHELSPLEWVGTGICYANSD